MEAIEIVHYMHVKAKGKQGDVPLKHDISDAYDQMNWEYLRNMMVQMGFTLQ